MNMRGDNDWDNVVLRKKQPKAGGALKSARDVDKAKQSGADVDTQKKWAGGGNRQHTASKDTAKLDRETDELKHDRVSMDVGRIIQQARQAKEWSQKDLAQKINEQTKIVTDYETGRAIPNNQILGKLERCLGVKLRGKDKGLPIVPKGSAKK